MKKILITLFFISSTYIFSSPVWVEYYIKVDSPQSAAKIVEATDNLIDSIDLIKKLNKKVGVSLNPDTKLNVIENILNKIDLVLIMSVFPGFGGQKFMPEVVEKIKNLKKIFKYL